MAAKPEYADVKKKLAKYLPATNAAPVEAKAAPAKKKKKKRKQAGPAL